MKKSDNVYRCQGCWVAGAVLHGMAGGNSNEILKPLGKTTWQCLYLN